MHRLHIQGEGKERMKTSSNLYIGGGGGVGIIDKTRKAAMIELSSFSSFIGGSFVSHLFWLLVGPLAC